MSALPSSIYVCSSYTRISRSCWHTAPSPGPLLDSDLGTASKDGSIGLVVHYKTKCSKGDQDYSIVANTGCFSSVRQLQQGLKVAVYSSNSWLGSQLQVSVSE